MRRWRSLLYAPLLKLAVCLSGGSVVGRQTEAGGMLWLSLLAVAIVVGLLFWLKPRLQSAVIALCCMLLGVVLSARQRQAVVVDWPAEALTVETVVTAEPVAKPKTVVLDLLLTGSGRRVKAYLQADSLSRAVKVGDGLVLTAAFSRGSDWSSGNFSYRDYLETHGFSGTAFVRSGQWHRQQLSLAAIPLLERTRLRFMVWRHQLTIRLRHAGLSNEQFAVVAAMVLGDKSALTRELKDTYSISGASHVLALSGLHLGIIYGLLSLFFSRRRRRVIPVTLSVLALWAFVLLVGMPPSVVRAAVMLSIYMLFSLAGRNRTPVNVLAFTAIVMLCYSPWALFDVGFQLSFAAMLAILVLTPLFNSLLAVGMLTRHRWLRTLWSLLSVSAAAQVGSAPLVAYYFGRFSTYFLLTNVLVIPVATLVVYLSLLTLAVPACGVMLTGMVQWLNAALTRIAALPYASIEGLHPTALQTVSAYVVIVAVLAAMAKWRGNEII